MGKNLKSFYYRKRLFWWEKISKFSGWKTFQFGGKNFALLRIGVVGRANEMRNPTLTPKMLLRPTQQMAVAKVALRRNIETFATAASHLRCSYI